MLPLCTEEMSASHHTQPQVSLAKIMALLVQLMQRECKRTNWNQTGICRCIIILFLKKHILLIDKNSMKAPLRALLKICNIYEEYEENQLTLIFQVTETFSSLLNQIPKAEMPCYSNLQWIWPNHIP